MRVIFYSLIFFLLSLCPNVQASTSLDPDTQRQLVRLEKKYFAHSFDGESDDSRVGRLEKQILGCTNSGDARQRVQNIIAATSSASITSNAGNDYQGEVSAPDAPAPQYKAPPARQAEPTDAADNKDDAGTDTLDSYPHVTSLEKTILQQSYAGQPLAQRLARMETKAFGHASSDPDFSSRTDALEDYAEQKLHKKSAQAQADESDSVSPGTGSQVASSGGGSDYPHVTALEKEILGQAYSGQPLPDRLTRMEVKAFGAASTNPDLSQRTDALEAYAEKKLHKKPFNDQAQQKETASSGQGSGSQSNGSNLKKQIANVVGNSLLGMVGLGGGGMASPFGGGLGPGSGFGLGGLQRRANNSNEPAEHESANEPRDPMVMSNSPPPPEARMLTKVGWCEMQVFGQTYPAMHLPERLGKLNRELNFEPEKSNVELMDDVGKMVKVVQLQKQSGKAIGAAPGATTH